MLAHLADRRLGVPGRRLPGGATPPLAGAYPGRQGMIAWARASVAGYGGDPEFIAIAGCSAGGHLASLAALADDPEFGGDTAVDAVVSLYGRYDWEDRESCPSVPDSCGSWSASWSSGTRRRHRTSSAPHRPSPECTRARRRSWWSTAPQTASSAGGPGPGLRRAVAYGFPSAGRLRRNCRSRACLRLAQQRPDRTDRRGGQAVPACGARPAPGGRATAG